ncbi:hypothetical protein C8J57DRAFT_1713389 [Mycena rebaudengoi]|nr:hypothetical protein C8J57DRAFT_1713389 [Mycena rebaudengoi]
MEHLPQELIDAIIDQFAPHSEAATPDGPDRYYVSEPQAAALMACALTSRSFYHGTGSFCLRESITSAIIIILSLPKTTSSLSFKLSLSRNLQGQASRTNPPSQESLNLDRYLWGRTAGALKLDIYSILHSLQALPIYIRVITPILDVYLDSDFILTSYVKYVGITLDSAGKSTDTVDFTLASRILALVPKLPTFFISTFHKAPHFRSLTLGRYTFTDLMELESLLSHAHGSRELTLGIIKIDKYEISAHPADPASHEALVVLDSLDVGFEYMVARDAVDAMLPSAYWTSDIYNHCV